MDEYDELEVGATVLPGVDLALWLRIVVSLIVLAAAVGGWLALR